MPLYPARNLSYINLKDYCKIDGSTDDSTAFTTAYTLAASLGMALWHPGGVLLKGNDTLSNTVRICGPGSSLATIKLKNGANTDLFSANTANINLTGTFGTGPSSGVIGNNWGFSGITLDGNQAHQTGGPSWVLRYYGYGEYFEDVIIQNGYSGGVLRDWYAATPNALTGSWNDVQVSFNIGDGIVIGGPTDLKFNKVFPNNNYGNNWHICQNAGGLNAVNCHSWAPNNSAGAVTALLIEANDCLFSNCEFEGSNTAQVALLGDRNILKGWAFAGGATGAGIKIGQQASETPILNQQLQSAGVTTLRYVNSNLIDLTITDITSSHGAFWYDADGGNVIRGVASQSSGVYSSGSPGADTLMVHGAGLTPDGSIGKSPSHQFFSSAFQGMVVGRSSDSKIWYVVDTFDGAVTLENAALLAGYSDNFATQQWSIDGVHGNVATNGQVAFGQSATAPDPGASGTVTTANVGTARVNPSGASRTGCILQAGTVAGQHVYVVNEHATNTISWATEATSNIATETGGTFVLSGKRMQHFVWDSSLSRWIKSS